MYVIKPATNLAFKRKGINLREHQLSCGRTVKNKI